MIRWKIATEEIFLKDTDKILASIRRRSELTGQLRTFETNIARNLLYYLKHFDSTEPGIEFMDSAPCLIDEEAEVRYVLCCICFPSESLCVAKETVPSGAGCGQIIGLLYLKEIEARIGTGKTSAFDWRLIEGVLERMPVFRELYLAEMNRRRDGR